MNTLVVSFNSTPRRWRVAAVLNDRVRTCLVLNPPVDGIASCASLDMDLSDDLQLLGRRVPHVSDSHTGSDAEQELGQKRDHRAFQ
jgi:hypothetical protein